MQTVPPMYVSTHSHSNTSGKSAAGRTRFPKGEIDVSTNSKSDRGHWVTEVLVGDEKKWGWGCSSELKRWK